MNILFSLSSISLAVVAIVLFLLCLISLLCFFGRYFDVVFDDDVVVEAHDASTTYIIVHGRSVYKFIQAVYR